MCKTPMTAPAALLELPDPIVRQLNNCRKMWLGDMKKLDKTMSFWDRGYIHGILTALMKLKILDIDEHRELAEWFLREEESDEQAE